MESVNNKGAVWRKWDLHLHSTASDGTASPEELIDEALKRGVSVIALTDHHTVDNLDHIKAVGKEKGITVISGIEFRTEYGQKSVHMIGLLPDKHDGILLNESAINDLILSKLGLSKTDIRTAGRNFNATWDDEKSYKEGLLRCQVDFKAAANLIHKYGGLVTVHAGSKSNSFDEEMKHEGNAKKNVDLADSLGPVKEELLRSYIDICEVRKAKEVGFYLTNYHKPCIAASDAHSRGDVARNFAWIKAEASFDGLRQIIFEPEARVKIQEKEPDTKRDYLVIDTLYLEHKDFSTQTIPLNPGLNTIIGGRSSGKSILLGCIARLCGITTDIKEGKPNYNKYVNGLVSKCKLVWRDGVSNEKRRVDYFPQGYIIGIASEKQKRAELVESLLRGESESAEALKTVEGFAKSQTGKIHTEFAKYALLQQDIDRLQEQLEIAGSRVGIEAEIQKLSTKIDTIKDGMPDSFTEEQELLYKEKQNSISNNERAIALNEEGVIAITQSNITDYFSGMDLPEMECDTFIKARIYKIFAEVITEADIKWKAGITTLNQEIEEENRNSHNAIDAAKKDEHYLRGVEFYSKNGELATTDQKLKEERKRLDEITSLENRIEEAKRLLKDEIETLLNMNFEYYEKLDEFCQSVHMEKDDVSIVPTIVFDEEKYHSFSELHFDGRANKNTKVLYLKYSGINDYKKRVKEIVNCLLEQKYVIKGGYTIDQTLEAFLSTNMFDISYDIQYQNDNLQSMSEGKAAFVILRLLLDFSNNEYPILIDQPEDELDNRAIYKDLVTYIRKKKCTRQIILVTHNPNIVVGADAEEIIVANQDGQGNRNSEKVKFEYRTGPLEESFEDKSAMTVLDQSGIREHVCEILEGGDEAFHIRECRYSLRV